MSSPIEILRQMPTHTAVTLVALLGAAGWLYQDQQIKDLTLRIESNKDSIAEIHAGYVTRKEMTDAIRGVEDSIGKMIERVERTQVDRYARLEKANEIMAQDIKRLLESK